MKNKVFLSYSHRDKGLAIKFQRELKKRGVNAFRLDEEAGPGTDIRKAVVDGIRQSDFMVVLLPNPTSANSSWISYEIGSASALGKDVFLMKSPSYSVGDLPAEFSGWRMIDLDPVSPGRAAETLISSLATA